MFRAEVSLLPPLAEIRVDIGCSPVEHADSSEGLRAVVDAFAAAARHGMFATQMDTADRCDFRFEGPIAPWSGEAARWRCIGKYLQAESYHVLLNLLASATDDAGIATVVIGKDGDPRGSPPGEMGYPVAFAMLPFAMEDETVDPIRRDAVVRIELANEVADEDLQSLGPILSAWQELVRLGGFSVTDDGGRVHHSTLGTTKLFRVAPTLAEFDIFGDHIPRAALDSLLNALAVSRGQGMAITSVELW